MFKHNLKTISNVKLTNTKSFNLERCLQKQIHLSKVLQSIFIGNKRLGFAFRNNSLLMASNSLTFIKQQNSYHAKAFPTFN